MKITFGGILPFWLVLLTSLCVLAAGGSNGRSSSPTEFELKLDSTADDTHSGYLKRSLDGVESHLVYVKSGSIPSKATESGTELWKKTNKQTCLAGVLNFKGTEKRLAFLVLLNDVSLNGANPVVTKAFKFENNEWKEKNEDEYYKELKSLVDTSKTLSPVDLDVSDKNKFVDLSDITKTKLGVNFAFHLPEGTNSIGSLKDSNTELWKGDSSKKEYGVNLLYGMKDDNNKFLVMLLKKDDKYEQKYFVYSSNKWEAAEFDKVKNIIKNAVLTKKSNGKKASGS